eukprot:gene27868-36717_t
MGSGSSVGEKSSISFSSFRNSISGRASSESRRISSSQSENVVVKYAEIILDDNDSDYEADSAPWKLVKLVFHAGRLTCQPHNSSNEPFSTSDSSKTDADDDDNDNETLFTYSLQKVESFHVNLPKIESETNKDSAFITVHAGENKMVIKTQLSNAHVWFSLFHASVHVEKSSQKGYEATSALFSGLKRLDDVVKKGGLEYYPLAGTTSAGLRAGNPTFICPFFGDQHFWAEMVSRSGTGPQGCPIHKLTMEILEEAFRKMRDPETKAKAQELGQRMNLEDGVGQGVQSFQRNLPVMDMLCEGGEILCERVAEGAAASAGMTGHDNLTSHHVSRITKLKRGDDDDEEHTIRTEADIDNEALVELFGGGVGSIHALEKHISSLSGTEGDEFDLSFMELAWLIIVKSRQNEVVT